LPEIPVWIVISQDAAAGVTYEELTVPEAHSTDRCTNAPPLKIDACVIVHSHPTAAHGVLFHRQVEKRPSIEERPPTSAKRLPRGRQVDKRRLMR
jgi:hypothetical protein